jgi:tetratricopeptide (TPR) repeat protein
MRTLAFAFLLLTAPSLGSTAAAQNAIDAAIAQYEAAAYEEALATLTRIGEAAPASRVEIEQYRALCLIALGNMTDAEAAVAALVAADPIYVPPPSVASPRVLSLVADIRKKELPGVARRMLDAGRAAFQDKDLARARQHFELLMKVIDDPAMVGRPEKEDLRTLAQGFLTLVVAAPAPSSAPVPATNLAAPEPTVSESAAATGSPAAVSTPPQDFYVPAIAIEQALPQWEPPSAAIASFAYSGLVRVRIGIDGKVIAAVVEDVSHPAYDGRLLEVAAKWLYKPALRNGVPVESEKVVTIRLQPQR